MLALARVLHEKNDISKLSIVYQEASRSLTIIGCSSSNESFKLSKRLPADSIIAIEELFPELQGIITGKIMADGGLHIDECKKIDLELQSRIVHLHNKLEPLSLVVKARKLFNNGYVKTTNDIQLQIVELFHNHHKMVSGKKLLLYTSPLKKEDRSIVTEIHNHGVLYADSYFMIKSAQYNVNGGRENQGDCVLYNKKGASIESRSHFECYLGLVHNDGSLKARKLFIRLGLGKDSASNRNIKKNRLINNGRVIGYVTVIQACHAIINDIQGEIIAKKSLSMLLTSGKAEGIANAGVLRSANIGINLFGRYHAVNDNSQRGFVNLSTGIIDFILLCEVQTTQFFNAGAIIARDRKRGVCKVRFRTSVDAMNTRTGVIRAQKTDISSTGSDISQGKVSGLRNFGSITGIETCAMHSSATVYNQAEAIAQSEQEVLISALGSIYNAAMVASHYITHIYALDTFHNDDKASVLGRDITVVATTALNSGAIESERNVTLQADTVQQSQNGSIQARKSINAQGSRKFSNDGMVNAEENIYLKFPEVVNLAHGVMQAKNDFTIIAYYMKNEGMIRSAKLLLQAVVRLSDSATAITFARELLTLISTNQVELFGNIGSTTDQKTRNILIQCFNLVIHEGAEVLSETELSCMVGGSCDTAGEVSTEGQMKVHALRKLIQRTSGILAASDMTIDSQYVHNDGRITAQNGLTINCQNSFEQTLQGVVEAGVQLVFSARNLDNAGIMQSGGKLRVKLSGYLRNQREGKVISADDMSIVLIGILENAGQFFSDKDLVIKAKTAVKNLLAAQLKASGDFNLQTDGALLNAGTIESSHILHIFSSNLIDNYTSGLISAGEALIFLTNHLIKNEGMVKSEGDLTADVRLILDNRQSGVISAKKALKLIAARLIVNAGQITSLVDSAEIRAGARFDNQDGGQVSAAKQIEVFAQELVNRDATIEADIVVLKAARYLANEKNGHILGKSFVELTSKEFANKGLVDAGILNVNCDLVYNHGSLTASRHLDIHAKRLLTNFRDGKIQSDDVLSIFTAHGLTNFGLLLSSKSLSLIAETVLHAKVPSAKLSTGSDGTLFIQALNVLLEGDIQAAADMLVLVENQFEYDSLTLKADGMLHIQFKGGRTIRKPIKTPGGLTIEILGADGKPLDIQAALEAGKDLQLMTPDAINLNQTSGFLVHTAGGDFSAKGASVSQRQAGVVSGGTAAYSASAGNVTRQYGFTLSAKGTFVDATLDSVAQHFVERTHGKHLEIAGRDISKTKTIHTSESDAHFQAGRHQTIGESTLVAADNITGKVSSTLSVGLGDNNRADSGYQIFHDPYNTTSYLSPGQLAQAQFGVTWYKIGVLYAKQTMKWDVGNADITGQVVSEGGLHFRAHRVAILRRQYRHQQTVYDVIKKKTLGIVRKKRIARVIDVATSQSEARLESRHGKLIMDVHALYARAGIISGAKAAIARASTNIMTVPNVDSKMQSSYSKSSNFFSSKSSSTHQARHTINPTCVLSRDGALNLEANQTISATSTFFLGKYGVRLHAAYIELLVTKIQEQQAVAHRSKKGMLSTVSGTYEYAKPVTILSPDGKIEMSTTGDFYADAPQLYAKDNMTIDSGGNIQINAIKLVETTQANVEGMNGLSYVTIDEKETHEEVIRPLFYSENGDVTLKARNGDVAVESGNFNAPDGDIIGISDNGVFMLKDVLLDHSRSSKTTQVGVTGLAASTLNAIMKNDFKNAAKIIAKNLLPPIEAAQALRRAEDGADETANGIKTLATIYDIMKGLANSDSFKDYFEESLYDQLSTVGISVSHSESKSKWQSAEQTWILARRIIIMAKDIKLHGIHATADEGVLTAENDLEIKGSAVSSQTSQMSASAGVSTNLRDKQKRSAQASVRFSYNEAEESATRFIPSLLNINTFSASVGNGINLRNVAIETKRAHLHAKVLKIESLQDEYHAREHGMSVGFDQTGINHLSANRGAKHERWTRQQAGIHASESLCANITEATHLVGAKISLGADAIPVDVNGYDMFRYPMPNDGDAIFHALGVSRAEASMHLLNHVDDAAIRSMVSHEIVTLLLTGQLPRSMQSPELTTLHREYVDTLLAIEQDNNDAIRQQHVNLLNRKKATILAKCTEPEVYQQFVLDCFAKPDYTPRFALDGEQMTSSLDAVAAISHFNIEIWLQNADGVLALAHQNHNADNVVAKKIEFTESGCVNLLASERSLLITPTLTYRDLDDKRSSTWGGFTYNRGAHQSVDFDFKKHRQKQKTRSTISESISVRTASDISQLNRDLAKAQEMIQDKKMHVRVYVPFISPKELAETFEQFNKKYLHIPQAPAAPVALPKTVIIDGALATAQTTLVMQKIQALRAAGCSNAEIADKLNAYITLRFTLEVNSAIVEQYYGENEVPKEAYEKVMAGLTPKIIDGKLAFGLPQNIHVEERNGELEIYFKIGDSDIIERLSRDIEHSIESTELPEHSADSQQEASDYQLLLDDYLGMCIERGDLKSAVKAPVLIDEPLNEVPENQMVGFPDLTLFTEQDYKRFQHPNMGMRVIIGTPDSSDTTATEEVHFLSSFNVLYGAAWEATADCMQRFNPSKSACVGAAMHASLLNTVWREQFPRLPFQIVPSNPFQYISPRSLFWTGQFCRFMGPVGDALQCRNAGFDAATTFTVVSAGIVIGNALERVTLAPSPAPSLPRLSNTTLSLFKNSVARNTLLANSIFIPFDFIKNLNEMRERSDVANSVAVAAASAGSVATAGFTALGLNLTHLRAKDLMDPRGYIIRAFIGVVIAASSRHLGEGVVQRYPEVVEFLSFLNRHCDYENNQGADNEEINAYRINGPK